MSRPRRPNSTAFLRKRQQQTNKVHSKIAPSNLLLLIVILSDGATICSKTRSVHRHSKLNQVDNSPLSIWGCMLAKSCGQNLRLLFWFFFFLCVGEAATALLSAGALASSIGCRILLLALMNQLLTWSNVRLVWAAMWRFSSSVGYGWTRCWNSHDLITLVACFGSTPRFCLRPPRVVKSLSQSSAEPPGWSVPGTAAQSSRSAAPSRCWPRSGTGEWSRAPRGSRRGAAPAAAAGWDRCSGGRCSSGGCRVAGPSPSTPPTNVNATKSTKI
jgi:hypothetical protein